MTVSEGHIPDGFSNGRAALVIAHPGHELLVHGWLELARPLVFVLTDGSGRTDQSRLAYTSDLLKQTGAEPGSLYGRMTDRAAYAAILDHNFDFFIRLAEELAAAFIKERIEFVAGDAAEGYSPTHDLCRLLINAAIAIVKQDSGRRLANFEFTLVKPPDPALATVAPNNVVVKLDEEAFTRKMAAAKGYAALATEVDKTLGRTSHDAYKIECLHAVNGYLDGFYNGQSPYYEEYGEKQVASGYYKCVLRYAQHIQPLAEAISLHLESRTTKKTNSPSRVSHNAKRPLIKLNRIK
jgi:hypothetical protein